MKKTQPKTKPYQVAIPEWNEGEYHDRDYVLLHVSFQVLVDYMEQEKPGETVDWKWNKEHRDAWKELSTLYKWWTVKRPARKDPYDEKFAALHKKLPKDKIQKNKQLSKLSLQSHNLEKKWHEEDQVYLHRLVAVRSFLWT